MYKFFKNLSCLLCLIIVFGGCRKKAFDDYYGRPATLQPPIYQVLQARGNFSTLLTVIDRSGYKPTLSASGYWTFFAPNDAAFQKYFTANSTSLDKIDSVTAGKIVRYCLVYNVFKTTDHIADYQSPTGWIANTAFKRRTTYYDGFFTGTTPAGANGIYVSENRNNGTYSYGDNNNKYIPYFYSTFMAQAGLTAVDYNYFFPNSTYSGFNVANASVVNKDILAENGVIHEIDQVVLPLPAIEQQLSNPTYSVFKSLYENYMVTYTADVNYTRQYNTVTNKTNQVYVKTYNNLLAFALGNESYLKIQPDDSQQEGYTLFAPNNTALNAYLGGLGVAGSILEYYGSVSSLPSSVIVDLLNAHMFQTNVWPSKFNSKTNLTGEPPRFDPGLPNGTSATSNIIDKQICSNGLFYGVNKVQQANVFTTVYARTYLDPAYSIMNRLVNNLIKSSLTSTGNRFTLFMLSDATLRSLGYDYSSAYQQFTYTVNGVTTVGGTANSNLQNLLYLATVSTPNNELNDLSGDGIAETTGGEYIRWHNNTVASGGTVELNKTVRVTGFRDYVNGRVYYLDNVIDESAGPKTIAATIASNAGTSTAQGPYYDFYQYLLSSGAYNPGASEILGVQTGANYTVLIPTNAAMKQAVIDGYLPGTYTTNASTGVKTFVSFTYNPSSVTDKTLVTQFIYYHILAGITVAPDGKKGVTGVNFPTFLKNQNGDPINLITFNPGGSFAAGGAGALYFKDVQNRQANITAPNLNPLALPGQTSSYVGYHVLIHQIDNYLRYN